MSQRSRPVLVSLTLLCVLPASLHAQDPGALVEGETARAADGYLERLEMLGFSGAALIIEDGRTVLRKGCGLAERETGIPPGPRDPCPGRTRRGAAGLIASRPTAALHQT